MVQLQSKKVYIQDLQPGMYVSGLDRPWLDTPFSLQGFMIRNQAEVKKLGFYCDYVYIDSTKSLANIILLLPQSPQIKRLLINDRQVQWHGPLKLNWPHISR
ncbi:DUF3391 domain-containing protein [Porticoccaceae bacterium]|nr:DUF3391 domain-containing protein [Porticoccaceae bacterium]